jgi:hypothetical protein
MGRILALLLLAATAACAPMAYQRPGVTQAQAEGDERECRSMAEYEAAQAMWMPWRPYGLRPYRPFLNDPMLERMRGERDLADFCMRARGYRLQPLPSTS